MSLDYAPSDIETKRRAPPRSPQGGHCSREKEYLQSCRSPPFNYCIEARGLDRRRKPSSRDSLDRDDTSSPPSPLLSCRLTVAEKFSKVAKIAGRLADLNWLEKHVAIKQISRNSAVSNVSRTNMVSVNRAHKTPRVNRGEIISHSIVCRNKVDSKFGTPRRMQFTLNRDGARKRKKSRVNVLLLKIRHRGDCVSCRSIGARN